MRKRGRNGVSLGPDEPILCPCIDCHNMIQQDQVEVERHVNCRGMTMTYSRWIFHGEDFSDQQSHSTHDDAYQSDDDADFEEGTEDNYVENNNVDDASDLVHDMHKSGDQGPSKRNLYAKLVEEARRSFMRDATLSVGWPSL